VTRYVRAWHALLNADGEISANGGRLLTVGIDAEGNAWLSGDAIGGAELAMGHGTAAWLAGTLISAVMHQAPVPGPRTAHDADLPRPVSSAPGDPHCGAIASGWGCTAQPGHGGPDHVAYGPLGNELHRWPADPPPAARDWDDGQVRLGPGAGDWPAAPALPRVRPLPYPEGFTP
jgi:hypothetical protein